MRRKRFGALPVRAMMRAHRLYPQAVGRLGLYGMAFFGHGRPAGLPHRATCEDVWRGLVRACALRGHGWVDPVEWVVSGANRGATCDD
jgi:hypothetical protein